MTSTQKLYESYFAVYNDELRETLAEETELFEDIDYLYDDELEEIVDEAIEAMIEEGFDLDEIEEAFEDILSEATVTKGRGNYTKLSSDKRSAPVTIGQGTAMRQQARRTAVISAARKRQAQAVKDAPGKAMARVKGAIQSGIGKARKAVDTRVGDYAAKRGLVQSKKGKPLNRTSIGMKQAAKDPSVRRGIRAAVVGDLASRAANKIGRGSERVQARMRDASTQVGSAVTAAGSGAKQAAQMAGSATKKAGKGLLGRVARKVASGAGKLASRLGEDVDVYDVVLEHLLEEGYADTVESAEGIMVNMSEEWIDVIVEDVLQEAPYQIYGPEKHGPSDGEPVKIGKPYKDKKRAKKRADRLDQEIGGYRHTVHYTDN